MNINLNQVLAIIIAVLGVWVVSAANLTDLFGQGVAKLIVSASALTMSTLSAILGVLTGQASQVKAVSNMQGVEPIQINKNANSTLAQLAVDPTQPKIQPVPADTAAVRDNARN